MERRVIVAALLATVLVLAAAPAASAAESSVRVQGAGQQVLARTTVNEEASGGTIADTDGTVFQTESATALGATALALRLDGVPWDMGVGSYGAFVNSIDGLASDPADYSNWWALAVNGYMSPVGAGGMQTMDGDSYVWFQNPDSTFSKGATLLVVSPSGGTAKRGFTSGSAVKLTVVGDDLSMVNSAADATRFSCSDIESPAEFPIVAGASVHVGERVYADVDSTIAITDLAPGTYGVWAEKAMDGTSVYVRSETTLINVGSKPSIRSLSASRTGTRTVRVRYSLSKSSKSTIVVTKGSKQLAKYQRTQASGLQTVTVRIGSGISLRSSLKITVTARDAWGRLAAKSAVAKGR